MEIFRDAAQAASAFGKTVVTIGNFDGVHCAHKAVIEQVRKRARELSATAMAITFEPHPTHVLRPGSGPPLITPPPYKLELLAETGLDAALVLPFSTDFASTTPEAFCRDYLQRLHVEEVHEGISFHFGHRAAGTVEKLAAYGQKLGFTVVVHPELRIRGDVVSSSRIRQLISQGRIERARRLLGREFSVHGQLAHGRGYGSLHTVPTVNLGPYTELLPAKGVYVTRSAVGGHRFDSVTNVGERPTFGAESFAVESHLLGFKSVPIEENTALEITFLHRLRDEVKWPSIEALKAQIARDVQRARRYFALRLQARRSGQAV